MYTLLTGKKLISASMLPCCLTRAAARLLYMKATLTGRWTSALPTCTLQGLSLEQSVSQFSNTMTAQADLRVEAAHLRRFLHNFRSLSASITAPRPVVKHSATAASWCLMLGPTGFTTLGFLSVDCACARGRRLCLTAAAFQNHRHSQAVELPCGAVLGN